MQNPNPATHLDKADATLQDMLKTIMSQEDIETATTIAEAINLYISSLRRREGRVKLSAADARGIMSILDILLNLPSIESDIVKLYASQKEETNVQS